MYLTSISSESVVKMSKASFSHSGDNPSENPGRWWIWSYKMPTMGVRCWSRPVTSWSGVYVSLSLTLSISESFVLSSTGSDKLCNKSWGTSSLSMSVWNARHQNQWDQPLRALYITSVLLSQSLHEKCNPASNVRFNSMQRRDSIWICQLIFLHIVHTLWQ